MLATSVTDPAWWEDLPVARPVLVIAEVSSCIYPRRMCTSSWTG